MYLHEISQGRSMPAQPKQLHAVVSLAQPSRAKCLLLEDQVVKNASRVRPGKALLTENWRRTENWRPACQRYSPSLPSRILHEPIAKCKLSLHETVSPDGYPPQNPRVPW